MKRLDISKEKLIDLYVSRGYSQEQCASILGVGHGSVSRYLEKYGIVARKRGDVLKGFNYQYKDGSKIYRRYIELLTQPFCHLCGDTERCLVIHHMDFDRTNNVLSNLIPLCHSCHRREHKIHESRYGFHTHYEKASAYRAAKSAERVRE